MVLCLLLFVALTAPAQGHVYWTNFAGDTVGRATLDGSGVDQSFIGAPDPPINPVGVAIDDEFLYWVNQAGSAPQGRIGRARLDGSEVDNEFITGANNPSGVALSATHIYWTNSGVGATTIGRAKLDGSEADQDFIEGLNRPNGIAVDANHIYWAELFGDIGRADLNGNEADTEFIAIGVARDVAVDDAHIYWADSNGKVGRASLDGNDIDGSFITDSSGTRAVDVNREHIFWTNRFNDTIGRANLDGSGVDLSFITGAAEPSGIAVSEPPAPPLFPAPVPADPARLRLLKVVRDKRRGTAKLIVEVSGAGSVQLAANKKVRPAKRQAKAAGKVRLPLRPKARAKAQLLEKGRVKVLASVTFIPTEGKPVTERWRRALVRLNPGLR
jgi:hypothetical protein